MKRWLLAALALSAVLLPSGAPIVSAATPTPAATMQIGSTFPGAVDDGLCDPTPTAATNNPSCPASQLQADQNDAIQAVERKVGTGASTPSAGTYLGGTGDGTSAYEAFPAAPTPAPTETPAPTATPIPPVATATPRATATQEAQGYDFSTATPAAGCILDAVSAAQVDCVPAGTAVTPAPTATPIPPVATATPRATATQEAQGYDFSTATPAAGCILDAVSASQVDCVAPGTAITPVPVRATDTPIPAVSTATPQIAGVVTTATPPANSLLYFPGAQGTPGIYVTPVAGAAAPTVFPTCGAGILAEGTGAQGLQCGSAALTTATPPANTYPYCSAGGAGCVLAYATPIPASAGSTTGTTLTNSLGSDVPANNTANYFDGPSVAQGTSGTWLATGTVTLSSSTADRCNCKLWDGTTVIDSGRTTNVANATQTITLSLSGRLATPAANIRISCNDGDSTSGNIKFNISGNSKDSTLTVVQLS